MYTQLSKYISYLLRHNPSDLELKWTVMVGLDVKN